MNAAEWPIITFEGVALPRVTIAIAHLGMYGNLPELSDEASKWLWHFTICDGIVKTDDSENIIRYAGETIKKASAAKKRLLETLPARFGEAFKPQVLDEWLDALRVMTEVAKTKPRCSWSTQSS